MERHQYFEKLVQKGKTFNFENNSEHGQHGRFSKPSDELLGWTAAVEQYVIDNYGVESAPYRLYQSFSRKTLSGSYKDTFDGQITIVLGALSACEQIPIKPKVEIKVDHQVISLIKNGYFWSILVAVIVASFWLGMYFGASKFDKEKSDFYDENKNLKLKIENNNQMILKKDSLINLFQKQNTNKNSLNIKE